MPLYTRESSVALVADAPLSMFAVPVMVPLIWLPTQVDTPPAASGKKVPNWYSHVPAATQAPLGHCVAVVHAAPSFVPPTHCWKHGVLLVHGTDVLLLQRWSLRS